MPIADKTKVHVDGGRCVCVCVGGGGGGGWRGGGVCGGGGDGEEGGVDQGTGRRNWNHAVVMLFNLTYMYMI